MVGCDPTPQRHPPGNTIVVAEGSAARHRAGSRAGEQRRGRFQPAFPLVEAKLHPPAARPGTIPRERLTRLLAGERVPPIVSVIAPPGYGKTLLLAEWGAREARPVAWLTLDEFDNVPSVFLSYLAVAIDRISPIDGSIRAAIGAPGSRILAAAVPRLASELHRVGRPAVIVLDDVHRLVDRTCLDALTLLLDHLPPGLQVVLAGRMAPSIPLGRWRVARSLLEIGRDDLAFDPGEAIALAAAGGVALGAEEARALVARTEGWAAGIYLSTQVHGRSQRAAGVAAPVTGPEGHIADYLRSELLADLPRDDVEFLTRSSILDVIEPRVAEVVVGLPGAGARLGRLAAANLLISEVGGAYRYHNLLRELLQTELDRLEPGLAPVLHREAASWFAAAGRSELAIEHAFRSDDQDLAAALVTAALLPQMYTGHADRLDRWLGRFEESAFRRRPPLAIVGGWLHLLNGRPEAAEHLADLAERSTFRGDPGDGSASFASGRALLRAVMARHGPEDMLADATYAASAEGPGSPWRTNALLMQGSAHQLLGDTPAAEAALADAVEAGAMAGAMVAWASLASLAIARGDWSTAERCSRESHGVLVRSQLADVAASLLTHAVAARIAIHRGDVARGRDELVRSQLVRPLATRAVPWFAVGARLELARAYLTLSDVAGARNVVAEAEAIERRRPALGVLNAGLAAMRRRLADASAVLVGSSALTAAELRLLPILSTPLTFREIGERVYLSPHTVKTQAISIYGKLQASSRSEAVERAIELGLLEPFPGVAPARRRPAG